MMPMNRFVKNELCPFVQNGVGHYGLADPSQQRLKNSIEFTKRPESLEVKSPSSNGYATKNILDNDELDEGSLPCTPELMSDSEIDVSSCPAGDEVLRSDTRQLMSQFLTEHVGLNKPQWNESKPLSTMKRVVRSVLEKHRYTFNGMINRLSLQDKGEDMSFVSAVATTLFADGVTNWGRVASLVAFGAAVCQQLKEQRRDGCVELVAQEICSYLLSHQREWLLKNNAWNGFVDFFQESDTESTVIKSLMAFAGVAGIGATLALLIR